MGLAALLGTQRVTDKAAALANITQLMYSLDTTAADLENAFLNPSATQIAPSQRSSADIAKTLLSYLGAIFIVAGICTYIGMFWTRMGGVMRVGVTLAATPCS